MLAGLIAALAALAPLQEVSAADDPEALWARGERLAAIEALTATWNATEPDSPAAAEQRARLVTWELAVHHYSAALEHTGQDAALEAQRGTALYRLARYDEALPHLTPEDPFEALLRLDALEALDRIADHERELAAALARHGESERLLALDGRRLSRAGDYPAAVARFRGALALEPCDAEALFGLGQALVRTGQRDEALEVLAEHRRVVPLLDELDFAQRGVDLAPRHASNHARVGDIERQLGRLQRAAHAYATAYELSQPEELVAITLRWARLASEDLNDPDAAVAILDRAFASAPDLRLLVRRGDVQLAAGRAEQAAASFQRALDARPGDAALRKRLDSARAAAADPAGRQP